MKTKKILLSIISIITVIATLSGCSIFNSGKHWKSIPEFQTDITEYTEDNTVYFSESEYYTEAETHKETTQQMTTPTITITSVAEFKSIINDLIDASHYTISDSSSGCTYYLDYEYHKDASYDLDYHTKLADGTEFTLPCSVKDLKNQGWVLSNNPDVNPNSILSGPNFTNDRGNKLSFVSAKNSSEASLPFDKCEVVGYYIHCYSKDGNEKENGAIGFTVCDTINENSTLEDIISKLGEPSNISCYVANNNNEYKYTTITITYKTMNDQLYSRTEDFIEIELCGDYNRITKIEYSKES